MIEMLQILGIPLSWRAVVVQPTFEVEFAPFGHQRVHFVQHALLCHPKFVPPVQLHLEHRLTSTSTRRSTA